MGMSVGLFLQLSCVSCPSGCSVALASLARQADTISLKRSAADSFEDSVPIDPRKRQHLQPPVLSTTSARLVQAYPEVTNDTGCELSISAAGIPRQANLAAPQRLDLQVKSVPARLDVGTPNLSSNAFNTSGFSVFSSRQDSTQHTKNHVCPPHFDTALISQVNDVLLCHGSSSTPANLPTSKTTANATVQREGSLAGASSPQNASDLPSTQTVDVYDYNSALAECARLERQTQALRDQLEAKTEECEQNRRKVPQLLADIVGTPRNLSLSGASTHCLFFSGWAADTPERCAERAGIRGPATCAIYSPQMSSPLT